MADPEDMAPEEPPEPSKGWWPPSGRQLVWGTLGAVALGGMTFWLANFLTEKEEDDSKLPPKGRPVCPQSPAPTAGLRAGDFAILSLANREETFEEMVWSQVLSRSPEGDRFLVRLLGTTGLEGVVDLQKAKHGFRIGDEIKVDANCVWDTMHAPEVEGKGQLYCGFAGSTLIDEPVISTEGLKSGDEVQVVVSTLIGSETHADKLWVKVDGVSRTGSVVYGTITSPIHFPMHGFRQWQQIEFGRDCVFGWRRP